MRYRKKSVLVEAFQMTEQRRWDAKSWPGWLTDAWNKNRNEEGAFFIDIKCKGKMAIFTPNGIVCLSFDDYIIQETTGELDICPPGAFEQRYELVKT